jgi:Conserved hypothetical protein (DUF2461)
MTPRFAGFSREAFAWFVGLERDNSKAYFTATRERYDADVRGAMVAMLDELSGTFGGEVRVFRQHRDVRFSPDKSPYKTRTYGLLQGAPGAAGGLYAELSARGLYAGTGYHQLAGEALEHFRQAVLDDGAGAGARHAGGRRPRGRAGGRRGEPAHRAARLPARPSPRLPLAPQGADRRPPPTGHRRHRTRGRFGPRRRHLAHRRTAQRVAR